MGVDLIPFFLFIPIIIVFPLFLICARVYARFRKEQYEQLTSNQGCMGDCCSFWAWAEWMHTVMLKTGEAWLEYVLKHNFESVDDHVILKGYRLPKWYVFWVPTTPVMVSYFVLVTFWDLCFIYTSYDCVPESNDVDCFLRNSSWNEQPLNCSEIKAISDDDFVCYKFVFDTALAAGAAGGILTLSTLANGWAIIIATKVSAYFGRFGRFIIVLFVLLVVQIALPLFLVVLARFQLSFKEIAQVSVLFLVLFTTITIFPWFKATKDVEKNDGNLCPPCFRCCCGSKEKSTSEESPKQPVHLNPVLIESV